MKLVEGEGEHDYDEGHDATKGRWRGDMTPPGEGETRRGLPTNKRTLGIREG